MLSKQMLHEMVSSKPMLTVCSLILLVYTGQMLLVFTQTWMIEYDALQIKRTQVLDVTERPAAMYNVYLERFGKTYGKKELEKRFKIFKESLKEIAYLNRVSGARHGLTKFSDVSNDEMFPNTPRPVQGCTPVDMICKNQKNYDLCDYPYHNKEIEETFDWRKKGFVGPVLDQKMCNACWAFGIVGVMESMAAMNQIDNGIVRRSIQELIDCGIYTNGCTGGHVNLALSPLCKDGTAVVTEEQYPLKLVNETCTAKSYPGRRIKKYCQLCNVDAYEILRYVHHHGPVIAVVNASPWKNYIDGVIQYACNRSPDNNVYDHVVQIVGYDTSADVPHFIIRNSWGEDFGINGYVKVALEGDVCGVRDEITFFDVY